MSHVPPSTPTRCPSCRRPSDRSHRTCPACTARHGAAAAKLLARTQADPHFASLFLGQLPPAERQVLGNLVMRRWLDRDRVAKL